MISVLPNNMSNKPIELYEAISKEFLMRALKEIARDENIPIDVVDDTFGVNNGALLSGLFSSSVPCIAIYHSNHKKDYHCLVIEMKDVYGRHYAYIHLGGMSKNARNLNMGKSYYSVRNGELNHHRPGILGKMFSNGAQQKLREEELYYDVVYQLIGSALARATEMQKEPTDKMESFPKKENNNQAYSAVSQNNSVQVKVRDVVPDTNICGEDVSHRIACYLIAEFEKIEGIDLTKDSFAMQRVIQASEKAKIDLADATTTVVKLPFITADATGPKHLNVTLSRSNLDDILMV